MKTKNNRIIGAWILGALGALIIGACGVETQSVNESDNNGEPSALTTSAFQPVVTDAQGLVKTIRTTQAARVSGNTLTVNTATGGRETITCRGTCAGGGYNADCNLKATVKGPTVDWDCQCGCTFCTNGCSWK